VQRAGVMPNEHLRRGDTRDQIVERGACKPVTVVPRLRGARGPDHLELMRRTDPEDAPPARAKRLRHVTPDRERDTTRRIARKWMEGEERRAAARWPDFGASHRNASPVEPRGEGGVYPQRLEHPLKLREHGLRGVCPIDDVRQKGTVSAACLSDARCNPHRRNHRGRPPGRVGYHANVVAFRAECANDTQRTAQRSAAPPADAAMCDGPEWIDREHLAHAGNQRRHSPVGFAAEDVDGDAGISIENRRHQRRREHEIAQLVQAHHQHLFWRWDARGGHDEMCRMALPVQGAGGSLPAVTSLGVLHIDTERGWRGGERQAFWLARELGRRGHRSFMACRPREPLADRCAAEGVSVVPCSPVMNLDALAALRLRAAIRRHGIDIVHAHTSHAATLGALATIGTGVPLIIARRVDFPLRGGIAARWKYERAAAVIAVSSAVARVVEQSGIARERVVVVRDGVDLERAITVATADTLRSMGIPPGAPVIVQLAALVAHKDPLTFVRAMRVVVDAVPAAHALIVGAGPLRAAVEREVVQLALAANVHVLGFRDDADALLAAADVVTLSSADEGLGSVLLDALAFGRPVAATSAGGIPEIVEHGVTGLLAPPRDAGALGRSIVRLVGDATLRASMSTAARARANEFSISRMVDATLDVYARALSFPKKRSA
jgi:glycosyltransferase involved in cell wall biosynthesis